MLKEILEKRGYPDLLKLNDGTPVTTLNYNKKREELLLLLEKHHYGKTPRIPVRVWGETRSKNDNFYAGKVYRERVEISFETQRGVFSFPIEIFIPKRCEKPPVFLHLAFRGVPDRYIPVEEITDNGYALVVLVYTDVVNDKLSGNFSDGLAVYFGTDNNRGEEEWGKIGMWAYAASRVMDYVVQEREDIDTERVAVIGHSRLGKTAIWCGAQDERFAAVISNDSGYGGAASSKYSEGEKIEDFMFHGSWDWFSENFKKYGGELENNKPYDQSQALALIAPRLLCVGSAIYDYGADPKSEFLTALHASGMWKALGKDGLICEDRLPVIGDHFCEGNISYHMRDNGHFLSREDWNAYIKFLNKKFKGE